MVNLPLTGMVCRNCEINLNILWFGTYGWQNTIRFRAHDAMVEAKRRNLSAKCWAWVFHLADIGMGADALHLNAHWILACLILTSARVFQKTRMIDSSIQYTAWTVFLTFQSFQICTLFAIYRSTVFVMTNQVARCEAIKHIYCAS